MPDELVAEMGEGQWDTLTASAQPVVASFWAEWNVPCRTVAPDIESAAEAFRGQLRFVRLNVDESPALIERYAIQGLPTLLVLQGGQVKEKRVGLMHRDDLMRLLTRYA